MSEQDFEREQLNPSENPAGDWQIHSVAANLEKALHFEARPEFNSALRSRLLADFSSSAATKEIKKRHRWDLRLFQGRQGLSGVLAFGMLSFMVVILLATTALPGNVIPAPAATTVTVSQPYNEVHGFLRSDVAENEDSDLYYDDSLDLTEINTTPQPTQYADAVPSSSKPVDDFSSLRSSRVLKANQVNNSIKIKNNASSQPTSASGIDKGFRNKAIPS